MLNYLSAELWRMSRRRTALLGWGFFLLLTALAGLLWGMTNTAEVMEAFAALYCTQAQRTDPHVSPVCATLEQLRGLCPALVLLAERDALRQEGEHYVRMLQEAGVDTEYTAC